MKKLVEALKTFGLSEYEAKVLLALIAKGELTAKEISEYSGVPRTSVYDVMKSLIDKGLVESYGKPMKFKALNSEDLMRIFSKRVEENLRFLREELPVIEREKTEEVKVYRGELAMDKIVELIKNAKGEVLIIASHVPEEMIDALKMTKAKVTICATNADKIDADSVYILRKFKTEFRHGMVLIDDRVVAIFFKDGTSLAVIGSGEDYVLLYKMLAESILNSDLVERVKR